MIVQDRFHRQAGEYAWSITLKCKNLRTEIIEHNGSLNECGKESWIECNHLYTTIYHWISVIFAFSTHSRKLTKKCLNV